MTDDEALLTAIKERSDDDLPRLVYADFLEEKGDAGRAEFIRVQCALAQAADEHCAALQARAQELWAEHRAILFPQESFFREKMSRAHEHDEAYFFRRGMLEGIAVDNGALFEQGKPLAERIKNLPIRRVRVVGYYQEDPLSYPQATPRDGMRWAEQDWIREIEHLQLPVELDDGTWRPWYTMAQHRAFPKLKALDLYYRDWSEERYEHPAAHIRNGRWNRLLWSANFGALEEVNILRLGQQCRLVPLTQEDRQETANAFFVRMREMAESELLMRRSHMPWNYPGLRWLNLKRVNGIDLPPELCRMQEELKTLLPDSHVVSQRLTSAPGAQRGI